MEVDFPFDLIAVSVGEEGESSILGWASNVDSADLGTCAADGARCSSGLGNGFECMGRSRWCEGRERSEGGAGKLSGGRELFFNNRVGSTVEEYDSKTGISADSLVCSESGMNELEFELSTFETSRAIPVPESSGLDVDESTSIKI